MNTDVIVIGSGLAGLQCARRLQRSGHTVTVLEAGSAVGGRIRTDVIDGFRCDRGFQVLNPAYPAVRSWVDVPALQLGKFAVGARIRTPEGLSTLAHPLRHPQYAAETLRSKVLSVSEVSALARWLGPTLLRPSRAWRADDDVTLDRSLNQAGVRGRLRKEVLDTFLAGVQADSSQQNSANYVRLLLRSFALGAPGLPGSGMQALPEQLAASLEQPVHLNTAAQAVRSSADCVYVSTDGGELSAQVAVVAVGPERLGELTGQPTPATHGLTTWWFRAPEAQESGPFLLLDARGATGGPAGPVWNTAEVTAVAPSYAPPGEHLIQATTLLDRPDGMADEGTVRKHLAELYRTSTKNWETVTHHVIPHTLPAQPPPLARQTHRLGDRLLVAGDHRDHGSIQGALASGDRAARAADHLLTGGPALRVNVHPNRG